MKRIFCWILILGLLICTGITGCAKKEQEYGKEIKIGAILPLSGNYAQYGRYMQQGMEIALEDAVEKRYY